MDDTQWVNFIIVIHTLELEKARLQCELDRYYTISYTREEIEMGCRCNDDVVRKQRDDYDMAIKVLKEAEVLFQEKHVQALKDELKKAVG